MVEARTSGEALAYVESNPRGVDLVLSDVVMPVMGGRELSQRLTRVAPSLPVLFMSGYTGEDVVQRGLLDAGAPFEQKPFSPESLARKVREMLSRPSLPAPQQTTDETPAEPEPETGAPMTASAEGTRVSFLSGAQRDGAAHARLRLDPDAAGPPGSAGRRASGAR